MNIEKAQNNFFSQTYIKKANFDNSNIFYSSTKTGSLVGPSGPVWAYLGPIWGPSGPIRSQKWCLQTDSLPACMVGKWSKNALNV